MTVEQQQDMDNNNIIADDGERKPTIKFNPLPKHAQNNKKHKRVKPPKMDDEQKKLAQARIDKQMNEGFEKIFFQKMLEICKEGGPKRVVPTGEEGKTKARASLEEVKEFARRHGVSLAWGIVTAVVAVSALIWWSESVASAGERAAEEASGDDGGPTGRRILAGALGEAASGVVTPGLRAARKLLVARR